MTIDNEINRKDYDPDGVVKVFAYDFRVDDADYLVVKEDGVVVVGGYTVSGVGDAGGGDVTFAVAPLDSVDVLTLIRDVDATQDTNYPALGPFPAGSHEDALDKLTMITQDQREKLDRAVLTETNQGPLSLPAPVAGKRIQWLADLSGFENVDSENDAADAAAAEALGYRDEAEGFADDAADQVVLAAGQVVLCEDQVVLATAQADAAAISAAAAALYNPTWEAWVNIAETSSWENKAGFTMRYRRSGDLKHLEVAGTIEVLIAGSSIPLHTFPVGYRAFSDSVKLITSYDGVTDLAPASINFTTSGSSAITNLAVLTNLPIGTVIYVYATFALD